MCISPERFPLLGRPWRPNASCCSFLNHYKDKEDVVGYKSIGDMVVFKILFKTSVEFPMGGTKQEIRSTYKASEINIVGKRSEPKSPKIRHYL